jgi:hypothetical protein
MLAALEHSAFSQWLLGSNSIWAYPTVLTVHTLGMMVLVGAVAMIDVRLLGFGRGIPLESLRTLFRVTWIGLAVNAVTGSMLFAADASKRAGSPTFITKLVLIAVGIATLVLIKRDLFDGHGDPGDVSRRARRLALVSILVWSGAVTAGRLLAYVN